MLVIVVINCQSGPGDVPVTADTFVVKKGVGAARKALVSCLLARVREAWYVRKGSLRISADVRVELDRLRKSPWAMFVMLVGMARR